MRRTEVLQEIRQMRFEEAYEGWQQGRLTQCKAARLLGVSDRTFRRYGVRYEEDGLDGLVDLRLEQVSHRRALVDEVMAVTEQYRRRHAGRSAKHFFAWYQYTTLSPIIVRREFGAASFGSVYGVGAMIIGLLSCLGPSVFGWLHDISGGYRLPFFTAAAIEILALAVILYGRLRGPVGPTEASRREDTQ